MCGQLIDKSPLQSQRVECLHFISPKPISHNATSMHDTNGGTWPQMMCPHIYFLKSKPLTKSSWIKQSRKSSYTILEGPSNERRDEHAKAKINVFLSKTKSIFGWKSSTKGGRSTSTNGWRWQRATMVLIDGVVGVLGPMHALLKHIPFHEQLYMCDTIMLMEVE